MSDEPRYYRAVVQVEILSDRPLGDLDLAEALAADDLSVVWTEVENSVLRRSEMAAALEKQGSHPGFLIMDWGDQEDDNDLD